MGATRFVTAAMFFTALAFLSPPNAAHVWVVLVIGRHAFRDTTLNKYRSFLSMDWGMRTISFAGK